jgi:hypothetical protein
MEHAINGLSAVLWSKFGNDGILAAGSLANLKYNSTEKEAVAKSLLDRAWDEKHHQPGRAACIFYLEKGIFSGAFDEQKSKDLASLHLTASSEFDLIVNMLVVSSGQSRHLYGVDNVSETPDYEIFESYSGFLNHPTNVKIDNQMVVFNIRDLEEELRPIAMFVVLQFIWNEMRSALKKRLVIVDEAWVMMKHDDAASFMYGIAKRCRKYYTGLTTITQDITDFLTSRYGKPIVTNSSLQLLLRQSPAAIDTIVETFYLTDQEKFLLLESNVGEGIFFAGAKHAAIKVIASYSEDQIITTDPNQLLEIEQAKKEFDEESL